MTKQDCRELIAILEDIRVSVANIKAVANGPSPPGGLQASVKTALGRVEGAIRVYKEKLDASRS